MRRKWPKPAETLETRLSLCERLHIEQPTAKDRLGSPHEPEVKCLSKGKAHKRNEFGHWVAVASSIEGNWIVEGGCEGLSYDGHTLTSAMATIEITGTSVSEVLVDKGYRGHDCSGGAVVRIDGTKKKVSHVQQQLRQRRRAVELIGHSKNDHRLGRCYLKASLGMRST